MIESGLRPTRTDRVSAAIRQELEDQRACLDTNAPLTSVSVVVHLHESGDVRRIQFRADRQRDVRGGRVLLGEQGGDR